MIHYLPLVDATLNAASALLLMCGFYCIRRKNIPAHRACMLSAFVTSILFLVCYLTYHYFQGVTRSPGTVLSAHFTCHYLARTPFWPS